MFSQNSLFPDPDAGSRPPEAPPPRTTSMAVLLPWLCLASGTVIVANKFQEGMQVAVSNHERSVLLAMLGLEGAGGLLLIFIGMWFVSANQSRKVSSRLWLLSGGLLAFAGADSLGLVHGMDRKAVLMFAGGLLITLLSLSDWFIKSSDATKQGPVKVSTNRTDHQHTD